jgi:hypothetical protein
MVARGAQGAHPCGPETPMADSRSNELRLVTMRRAAPHCDAVVMTHTAFTLA